MSKITQINSEKNINKIIIAIGGGGFSENTDNLYIEQYILSQLNKKRPKVCFLPTASGDSENYISRFYNAFNQLDCMPTHLSLFKPPTLDLESFICECDIIYVGGGNTKNMLALWKMWELDKHLEKAYKSGVILTGLSAGAICWFEEGLTDSLPGAYTKLDCLGFLPGSCCPHFDSEPEREPVYIEQIEKSIISAGYGIEDNVALHFEDGKLKTAIAGKEGKKAYFIDKAHKKQIIAKVL